MILKHDDGAKEITLHSSRDSDSWRGRWERAARSLGLPALEQSADGLVERPVEDLDKPVSALLEEGKLTVDYDLLEQKAEGIAVDLEGEEIVVTRLGPRNHIGSMAVMVLAPLVFIGVALYASFDGDPAGGLDRRRLRPGLRDRRGPGHPLGPLYPRAPAPGAARAALLLDQPLGRDERAGA